jgi:hypothetical protein
MASLRTALTISVLTSVAALAACSSSSGTGAASTTSTDDGTGNGTTTATGAGGAGTGTGTGGGGTTTTTGAGGAASGACSACWPACFTSVSAACPPSGACTTQTTQAGNAFTTDLCYADGVKWHIAADAKGSAITAYDAQGGVCFTTESVTDATDVVTTYKDPKGDVIATVKSPLKGGPLAISCGGSTYTVDTGSADCKACSAGSSSSQCVQGTCTAP